MSDSDDDVSVSGSEDADADDDDVEMEEVDECTAELENPISDLDDNDVASESGERRNKWFQKEIWQHRKLPYYSELDRQANRQFALIKKGLSSTVLLNDAAVGFNHWVLELERYVEMYNRRFSKEEHINCIQLIIPMVEKGKIFRNVKVAIHALNLLLSKRDFLVRGDMIIDWRPLYELYMEVSFKSLEEDGIFLMPDGFRNELHTLIFYARNFFVDSVVQEILDECRPFLCVWDESMIRAWKIIEMFTPMNLPPEQNATLGTGLWFDEAWHWYSCVENNSLFEPHIMKMFARVSYESPGLIDWSERLDVIFDKLIRSLRLSQLSGHCQNFNMDTGSTWLVYMLGTNAHQPLMKHIEQVLNQIESFLHPSNNGSHTQYLLNLIHKLTHHLLLRVKRERSEKPGKPKTINMVPENMKLTQEHLNEFVTMMLPCMKLAIFTKSRNEFVNPIYKACGLLAPKIVLPVVLDMVYPALETLVEPHRLIQTMNTLLGVLMPLVKDQPDVDGKTYRTHAITLLNSLLPGLDYNDISKCMITYQVVGVLVNLIPLVDCSEAVHLRNDLTEDERELCSATANFESIISMMMQRMLEMLVDCGQTASTTSSHGSIAAKTSNNIEESILHRGTISVFKGICRNSSTELYKVAMEKVYDFACEHVFDSKIVSEALADMIHASVKMHPEFAFQKFFKLIMSRLQSCITPEFYTEDKVDFHVIWWLTMASRVVKAPSEYLLKHWDQVRELLQLVLPMKKCSTATERALSVFDSVLDQLCTVYIMTNPHRRMLFDKPLDEYLAIRNWAASVDMKTWQPYWHIPTDECIERATEMFRDYVVPTIKALDDPKDIDKKGRLHHLWLLQSAALSAAPALPLFEGEILPLNDAPTIDPQNEMNYIIKPDGTPEISVDGKNGRQIILDCTLKFLDYLLVHSDDDVKSIREAIILLKILPANRGLTKEIFTHSANSFRVTKAILCDRLAGNKSNIEMIAEEYVSILHKKRICNVQGYNFKQQHIDILKMLLRVSTSAYSENRTKAQAILIQKMREYPYSYKYILDDILNYLDPESNSTHEQIKGALYILIDGKRQALCLRMDFDAQKRIWPAIVATTHSEKPSIIGLMETAQNIIVENYESYRMRYEWKEANVQAALRLLDCAEGSPLQPAWLTPPTAEEMAANADNLEKRYERTKTGYLSLISRLVELATDPNRHWRPVDMAHAMLSMLIRRDEPYPDEAVRLFVRLLVHDAVKTRRIATAVIASWLRMTKPKANKREYVIPYKEENTGPGAKFPIRYGLRDDNRIMTYEEEKLPKTTEEWDTFQFCGKQHWGIYTWPKKLVTYAPLIDQTAVNRDPSEFSETEKFVVRTFMDKEFVNKLRVLFAVEEKKGEEVFNAVNMFLFQGLFRVFNDSLCSVFHEQLEMLTQSSKETDQKLAAEIISGLINGSKLWRYAKQEKMWTWLAPILTRTFETIKEDSLRNWGVALASVCGSTEARMVKPLLDLLFRLVERPTDNAFSASSRLFLLQSSLSQFEWRALELWNRFIAILRLGLVQQYANLRERVATSLVAATWYDLPTLYVSPNYPESMRPPKVGTVLGWYQEQLGPCWEEVRIKLDDPAAMAACAALNGELQPSMTHSASSATLFVDSEVKRTARLALRTAIAYVFNNVNQSYIALSPEVINMFPLFCHYSNDVGDEDLQRYCASFLTGHLHANYIAEEKALPVVQIAAQILTSSCWWKAKVALLRLLRMLVFSNTFAFIHHREQIGMLLVKTLADSQIEVRERAAEALSALLQSKFFEINPQLVEKFTTAATSSDAVVRHGGVLGLSAIVLAFPYSVPSFLPDVLMQICRFATEKQPIRDTVKRALSEFKRTHQDSWREHVSQFNADQLMVLRDLLVSPNYYV